MAPRANWKGFLKVGELTCAVALYTAASTSERISFHTLNRKTGNRVRREFVDSETGKTVERDDQVKGYEDSNGRYIVFEPDEIAAAVPDADKMLDAESFISCDEIDDVYFDKPYYLAPADKQSNEVFNLIRNGLKKRKVAAIAETVLFRRVRKLLIRPYDRGLVASTLNFEYEVRSAKDAFSDTPNLKIEAEMLELANHIIGGKIGKFDPSKFEDRYEDALTEVVKAKIEGRKIKPQPVPEPTKVVDLMEALRQSAGMKSGEKKSKAKTAKRSATQPQKKTPTRKAG
ncbi:DNA end-binding protein Ku [Pararhizobium capsulatum DSM 1112]|uniref:Non-homologous end joining protein Ku n=1 Tax=Pararhizobium capsulatum DSM 1112 TaxID=1121113 RepID=A0ABU0BYH1_9HYPH|nr:Ku protein [Pararhizobium capsulatum]MDQ0323311.1 DNA end-binding protein Ku [Pararhizobium capsulatum DSM 1112]